MLPLEDVIHLAVIGLSQGCAYGLIALGFVLIYKATEVVNFAHGEFMMLGAFSSVDDFGKATRARDSGLRSCWVASRSRR